MFLWKCHFKIFHISISQIFNRFSQIYKDNTKPLKNFFHPSFSTTLTISFSKNWQHFFRLSVNQNSFFTPLVVRMCFLFYSTRNENYVNNIYICLFISSGKSFPNDVKYTLYMIYIREKYLYKRKERLTELEKKVFFDRKSFEL